MSHGIDWVPSKLYTTHKQLVFVLSCKDDINIISTTCQKHSNQANMFYRRCSVVRRRSSAQEYKYHVNFSQNSNTFTIIENLQNSVHSTYFYSYLIDMRSGILRILFLIAPLAYATVIPDAAAHEDLVIAREDLKAAEGLSAAAACKCKKVSNAGQVVWDQEMNTSIQFPMITLRGAIHLEVAMIMDTRAIAQLERQGAVKG
jgi:hypothetical protein